MRAAGAPCSRFPANSAASSRAGLHDSPRPASDDAGLRAFRELRYASASMRRNRTPLDLFLELQTLDRVPRTGFMLRGVDDSESVTEHSWHVLFLVWALGSRIEGIDVFRAVE